MPSRPALKAGLETYVMKDDGGVLQSTLAFQFPPCSHFSILKIKNGEKKKNVKKQTDERCGTKDLRACRELTATYARPRTNENERREQK